MVILAAIQEHNRSKETLRIAHDLATRYEDTLVVLHVVPAEDYEAHKKNLEEIPDIGDFSLSQEQDSAERFVQRFIDETIDDVEADIEPRGAVGDVASEILAEAETLDPRFLVIGGKRRSPTGKALFGDTAQRILLNASCPVVSKLGGPDVDDDR